MADTATYAGAMKTGPRHPIPGGTAAPGPDTGPYTAKGKGDRRPGSLRGGHPIGVHRSAAQKRLGRKFKPRQGAGARTVQPGPKSIPNVRPL